MRYIVWFGVIITWSFLEKLDIYTTEDIKKQEVYSTEPDLIGIIRSCLEFYLKNNEKSTEAGETPMLF